MKKITTWTCDGTVKNPDYINSDDDFGGPHPPQQNTGSVCIVCSMPREAVEAVVYGAESRNKSGKWKRSVRLALPTLAAILLVGGGLLTWKRKELELVCAPLGICAKFDDAYTLALLDHQQADSLYQAAKSLTDLDLAANLLQSSSTQIATIPAKAKIYPQAQTLEDENQQLLTQLEDRRIVEEKAKQDFDAAIAIAKEADMIVVEDNQSYSESKANLENIANKQNEAIKRLSQIPEDTFLDLLKQEKLTALNSQVDETNELIAALQPPRPRPIARPPTRRTYPVAPPPQPIYEPQPPVTTQPLPSEPALLPCSIALYGDCIEEP
jgi:hypothetical protein